jgi:hypothetical protein
MRQYKTGIFKPVNREKYVGDSTNIVYRSSWEFKFMKWADSNPMVLKWASEELVVPYISPIDHKPHRYFVDFVVMVKNRKNEIKKYAVEVKPDAQTMPPKQRKKTQKYLTELTTYAVNQAKWEAADKFCRDKGLEFIVLTEKHLF